LGFLGHRAGFGFCLGSGIFTGDAGGSGGLFSVAGVVTGTGGTGDHFRVR